MVSTAETHATFPSDSQAIYGVICGLVVGFGFGLLFSYSASALASSLGFQNLYLEGSILAIESIVFSFLVLTWIHCAQHCNKSKVISRNRFRKEIAVWVLLGCALYSVSVIALIIVGFEPDHPAVLYKRPEVSMIVR